MRSRVVVAAIAAIAVATGPAAARPAPRAALTAEDLIALEICYTTVLARYYKPVAGGTLLTGARDGIVAYLRGRGIDDPRIPFPPPHADRWSAENAIDRDVALAVARHPSIDATALVDETIAGELAELHDPYSVLFRPAAYKKFVGFLDEAPIGGIGAELDVDPVSHAVRVVDVFPNTPAASAGIAAGDTIVAIDGRPPAVGVPDAVAAQLRGAPGTAVIVTIARNGTALPPMRLVRARIVVPDATGRMLPGRFGYLRLRAFGADSPKEFDAALAALRRDGARAYILDLRGDGGGYRDAAIAIASHFVGGTIVTTQERGAPPQRFTAAAIPRLAAPLAVLVDGDTASAAEIVAGAIQDDRAGMLVGTRTFGKGLVQETFALPHGAAIKLTTAVYRTPAGRDIEGRGLVPDVVVPEPPDAAIGKPGSDPQLDRALLLLGKRTACASCSPPSPRSS